jgi:signal transduction histidine kinase
LVLTRQLHARERAIALTPRQMLGWLRLLTVCAAAAFMLHDSTAYPRDLRTIVALGALAGQQAFALVALGRDDRPIAARVLLAINLICVTLAASLVGDMAPVLLTLYLLLLFESALTLRPTATYLYTTALSVLYALSRFANQSLGADRDLWRADLLTLLEVMGFFIIAGLSNSIAMTWKAERTHVEQLALLDELSLLLGDTRRLEDVLENFVELVPQAMRAQGCALAIRDPGSGRRIWVNLGADVTGMIDEALLAHDPAAVEQVAFEPRIEIVPDRPSALICTMPLAIDDRTAGVLSVARPKRDPFSRRDLRLFTSLARHAAQAIRNARLYQLEQDAATQSRALEQFKSEMLASVSHEFRLPLSSITLAVETLIVHRETASSDDIELRLLRNIQRSAQRLSSFVQDVLDLARMEAHQLELRRERCDLAALVHSVCDAIGPQCEAKCQRLRVRCEADPCIMMGDPSRLEQVVSNLLMNAHQYTPEGGEIEVALAHAEQVATLAPGVLPAQEHAVALSVRDTGPGIPLEERAQIFERFSRGSAGRRRSAGAGLGLHIARSVVEWHGGRIWVDGNAAGGSTFWCLLPLTSAGASGEAAAEITQGVVRS